jgi:protein-S-isoprenylcysteine O-methyltransferase Ste14
MFSLYLRNLFFTIIHPGLVVGLIPYWLLSLSGKNNFRFRFNFYQYLGISLFLMGLFVLLHCIIRFAVVGRGTLSPIDPTKKLVTSGIYRYTRNPMYLGVMITLMGEVIFFKSYPLGIYLLIMALIFNLFILVVEEPRLHEDFGDEYSQYRNKVRRWL